MVDLRQPHDGHRRRIPVVATSWHLGLVVGVVTAALGIVVALHPGTSLNVLSVLIGVLLLASGVFHLFRALRTPTGRRAWSATVGLAFVILGIVLVRHLDVTIALIAVLVGITWIVQGVVELITAQDSDEGRGWRTVFGTASLVAGIVLVVVPVGSLTFLAVLVGVSWIVIGLLEIVGALALRRAGRPPPGPHTSAGEVLDWPDGSRRQRHKSPTGSEPRSP